LNPKIKGFPLLSGLGHEVLEEKRNIKKRILRLIPLLQNYGKPAKAMKNDNKAKNDKKTLLCKGCLTSNL